MLVIIEICLLDRHSDVACHKMEALVKSGSQLVIMLSARRAHAALTLHPARQPYRRIVVGGRAW